MRGRKRHRGQVPVSPRRPVIKKESPNEGTETFLYTIIFFLLPIKKESPNEGTETIKSRDNKLTALFNKKRIPE